MSDISTPLETAARELLAGMSSTYRARNGRQMGIEADDGEKCYIVHSDLIHALEAALTPATAPVREAIAKARESVVLSLAFLGRDYGTDRFENTFKDVLAELAKADDILKLIKGEG